MPLPLPLEILAVTVSGLFGAVVGSFLNVCIYRLPRSGLTPNRPRRSFCPSCGNGVPWYDNIPLLSWLALGGRCRFCRSPISVRYLVIEALTAALFAVVALRYLAGSEPRWGAFIAVATLCAALIVASAIDLELRILPNAITVGGMMLAPFVALAAPGIHLRPADDSVTWLLHAGRPSVEALSAQLGALSPTAGIALVVVAAVVGVPAGLYGYAGYWRIAHPRTPKPLRDGALAAILTASVLAVAAAVVVWPHLIVAPRVYSFTASVLGMASGATLVFVVGVVGTLVFRKDAMGFGDVKLMGLLGAFTGWFGVLLAFFLACLIGSVVGIVVLLRHRSHRIPFGPFLSGGALAMLLCPELVASAIDWYLGLF